MECLNKFGKYNMNLNPLWQIIPSWNICPTRPKSLILVLPSGNFTAWWCHFSIELILSTLALWNRMTTTRQIINLATLICSTLFPHHSLTVGWFLSLPHLQDSPPKQSSLFYSKNTSFMRLKTVYLHASVNYLSYKSCSNQFLFSSLYS